MDIIEYLEGLHDQCLELSKQLRFDKHHELHFELVSLYGSLIELVGCILILVRNNAKLGVPSLFRTFLETYVEFHNLVRDSKYGYYREASYLKEWLRVLKSAGEKKNSYLAKISALPNISSLIKEKEKQLISLKNSGYTPLTIKQKFERADMIEEYLSMYNFLCTESHSDKRALIDRHAAISNDGYELILYKNHPIEKYFQYLGPAAEKLGSATSDIHNHLGSPALSQINDLRQQLNMIQVRET
jgi:hypothetical protein